MVAASVTGETVLLLDMDIVYLQASASRLLVACKCFINGS